MGGIALGDRLSLLEVEFQSMEPPNGTLSQGCDDAGRFGSAHSINKQRSRINAFLSGREQDGYVGVSNNGSRTIDDIDAQR